MKKSPAPTEPTKIGLFDLLKDVSYEKKNLWETDPQQAESAYSTFVVNLMLSYHPDCILIVNELNCRRMKPKWHYDYLLKTLTPRKRYSKTEKPTLADDIGLLVGHLNISQSKALEVYDLLSAEDLADLRKLTSRGGKVGKSAKQT